MMAAFSDRKVLTLVGELHPYNKTESGVRALVKKLKNIGLEHIYTGHFTGKPACDMLKETSEDVV